jgi:outer membrane protein assembly factor BamE (lipoprotein component of BamABCDE complex)
VNARALIPVLALAAGLSACANVEIGNRFDRRMFESKVERGVTTQAQVRGWLGAPTSTGVAVDTSGERFDEWTYYYGSGRLPNMADAEFKMLQIKFDHNGIVRGYNWSGNP